MTSGPSSLAAQTAVPKNTVGSAMDGNNTGSAGGERMPMPMPMPVDGGDDEEDANSLPSMQPMSRPPASENAHPPANAAGYEPAPSKTPDRERPGLNQARRGSESSAQATAQVKHSGSTEDLIHSAEQFTATLSRLNARGERSRSLATPISNCL